jgi:hypothetical protein
MMMRRVMDGEEVGEAWGHVRRDLLGVVLMDYRIWPVYDILCFTLLPRHIQATSTAALSTAWAAYLSWVTHV